MADRVVLLVDPGESTGWATIGLDYPVGAAGSATLPFAVCEAGTLTSLDQWIKWEESMVAWRRMPSLCIVEDYHVFRQAVQAHIGSTPPSVYYIGVVEFIARKAGWPVLRQQPSFKNPFPKSVLPDYFGLDVLKQHSEHELDCLRHFLYFYYNNVRKGTTPWDLPMTSHPSNKSA